MQFFLRWVCVLGGSWLMAGSSFAADAEEAIAKRITTVLEASRAEIKVSSVEESPMPGLYRVQIQNGPTVYATADGGYFVAGDLYATASGQLTNLTEQARSAERKAALDQVKTADQIVFSPKGKARTHITVFTDVDCGYCRMLHQEVPKLNDMGVEVRYMAFPRAGVSSDSYRKLATAWCADNPQDTLTKLKNNEAVPHKVCEDNPVAQQYLLGQQLGVNATPAILLENGELQLGYMKAAQLAARLGL